MTSLPPSTVAFGPLTIAYDASVLHPRPWTIRQSELAVELARTAPDGPVLELFSGVGHIGLLAASQMNRALVQVDIDERTCDLARTNVAEAALPVDVEVRCGPLESVLRADERFAVLISDPPWVPSAEIDEFPDDPPLAIDGGPDGLSLARRSLALAQDHMLAGGCAVVQVGPGDQADFTVAELDPDVWECLEIERHERGSLVALRAVGPTRAVS